MSKKMKTFIMVCGVAIGTGLLLAAAGAGLGGVKGLPGIEEKIPWISFGGAGKETADMNLQAFRSIDVQCDTADVEFAEGSKFAAEVSYDKKNGAPEIDVKSGVLTVRDKGTHRRWFHFDVFGRKYAKTEIKIYYPKGTVFDKAKVQNDMGYVGLARFKAKDVDIYVDSGYVLINDIRADRMKLDVDMGSAEGSRLALKGADLTVDTGSIELSGRFAGRTKADCDMGSCLLKTNLPKNSYSIDASSDMGDCTIDGKDVGETYKSDNRKAKNKIILTVDMGSAEVEFF